MLAKNREDYVVDYSANSKRTPTGPANDTSEEHAGAQHDAATIARSQIRAQARAPRHRINRKAFGRTMQAIDIFAGALLAVVGAVAISGGQPGAVPAGELFPVAGFAALLPLMLSALGLYRIEPRHAIVWRLTRAVIATASVGATMLILGFGTAPQSVGILAIYCVVAVSAMTLLHLVYAGFIGHWAKAGRLARNIILVGATPNARKLILANQGSGTVNVVGYFDDRKSRAPTQLAGTPYLGTTDDLFNWSVLPDVDRVVLTVTPKAEDRVKQLLEKLRALPQQVILLLDINGFNPETTSLDDIVGVHTARMSGQEENLGRVFAKRVQDIVFASLMTIAALPVMALIALLVKLDSRGPALFVQKREGFNGRPISVYKFRTMRHDPTAEAKKLRQVELNDPRVTRLGGFLRKTSLDELPQLFNVLAGSMSLVGPRPHAYGMRTGGTATANLVAEYAHRHRVKPGITGWAQVNGSRGPLHTPETARERIKWDVDYIARSGFWFDLWIMLKTVPALLGDKVNIR